MVFVSSKGTTLNLLKSKKVYVTHYQAPPSGPECHFLFEWPPLKVNEKVEFPEILFKVSTGKKQEAVASHLYNWLKKLVFSRQLRMREHRKWYHSNFVQINKAR